MQENEFEKSIRKKMEEFQLVPADEVWLKISVGIEKDKRKKRFIAFWVTLFLLVAAGGGWYFYNDQKVSTSSSSAKTDFSIMKNSDHQSQLSSERPSAKNEKGVSKSQELTNVAQDDFEIEKSRIEVNKEREKIGITASKEHFKTNILRPAFASMGKRNEQQNKSFDRVNNEKGKAQNARGLAKTKPTESERKQNQAETRRPVDSAQNAFTEKGNLQHEKDTANGVLAVNDKKVQKKTKVNKGVEGGFTVFGGVSNNVSNTVLNNSASADFQNVPGSTASGGSVPSLNGLTYKTGLSFGFGAYAMKWLGKRTGLSVGVNYYFMSSTSYVGGKTVTNRTFYDSVLETSATVNEYYVNGRDVKYVNKYHLLQVPINLLLQLNKSERNSVVFSAGVAPAFLVGSNALHANYRARTYYKDNNQFRRWMLFGEAGLQLGIATSAHFKITAGPEANYSFTSMANPMTNTNQHLFSVGLKANVGLK
jgi:hypothetical protein